MITRRVTGAAIGLALAAGLPAATAHAHHVPGHGSSEGVRSINSLGNRGGKASSRLMILNELALQPTAMVPALRNELSLLGEYAPLPALSFGAQLPLTIIDEQGSAPVVGYGDTRAFVRYTPHADKLIHRTLTFNVAASFPTRSFRTVVDPGRTWSVAPSVIFTRTYSGWYWQAIGLASFETRPAGHAIDLSVGGQAGGKLAGGKLAIGGGVLVDVRAANWCARAEGPAQFCRGSRAGEIERGVGATRATALATGSWQLNPRWSLTFAVQLPFTAKRDFDFGATVGAQVVF